MFKVTRKKVYEILSFYSRCNYELEINDKLIKKLNKSEDTIEEIEYIRKRKEELLILRKEIKKEIDGLTTDIKLMVYEAYILKNNWIQISIKNNYSVDHCRHLAYKGISILKKKFEENEIISEFL